MAPTINTYLFFDGTCEEAMKAYETVLGGKLVGMMKVGGSPAEAHMPPGSENRVMHACLELGGRMLMASDGMPGRVNKQAGFNVQLEVESIAEAERIYNTLSEGGEIEMPLGPTFWAERFGSFKDRWGTPWMVNYTGNVQPSAA